MVSFRSATPPLKTAGSRSFACRLACLPWLLALLPLLAHAQSAAWNTASDKDGIRLETRPVAGQRFDELRVSTHVALSPATIADYLFGRYLEQGNRNISRTFIRRGRELTLWSDVLRAPMMGERCYSMRFEREALAHGGMRVRFASVDFVGSKPSPDCIALHSRGEWLMTPTATGTRLSYASLTDVGGRVPVSLARRSLSAAAIMSVRKVVAGASGLPLPRGIGD